MRLSLVAGPELEPVSLDEAKAHLRIPHDDEDDAIEQMITAARERIEDLTGRQLITATWTLVLDWFPPCGLIDVPRPPLQSVTSIAYVDANGDTQTWASDQYRVDTPAGPKAAAGRITPGYGISWPSTLGVINAVTMTFDAGYGDIPTDVPAMLRRAMLLIIGHLYEHREETLADQFGQGVMELPLGVNRLIAPYVVRPMHVKPTAWTQK